MVARVVGGRWPSRWPTDVAELAPGDRDGDELGAPDGERRDPEGAGARRVSGADRVARGGARDALEDFEEGLVEALAGVRLGRDEL